MKLCSFKFPHKPFLNPKLAQMEVFRIKSYNISLSLLILMATLFFQNVLSAQMTTTTQQPVNQEEQPSLSTQGTSPFPTTSGSSKGYTNEGTPTFEDSSDNHIVQDSQPGYTEGGSSGSQMQGSQQGYQGQQQFGYPQQGTNQPFSANNPNNNNNYNNQLSPFSKLPFAVNNQQGSTHAFFNGAVGTKSHEKFMLASLMMNLMVAFGVLLC